MDKLELLLAMARHQQFFHVKNPQILYRFGQIVEMTDVNGMWYTAVSYYGDDHSGRSNYVRPLDCFENFRVAVNTDYMLDPFEVEVL